jgi:hypothetical protein
MTTTSIPALTPIEWQQLADLEQIVEDGLQRGLDAFEALAEINKKHLYRATHATFADYCRERWQLCDGRFRQLRLTAPIIEEVKNVTTVTLNERQARELVSVPAEVRPALVEEVAAEGKVTSAAIREKVEQFRTGSAKTKKQMADQERQQAFHELDQIIYRKMVRGLARHYREAQRLQDPEGVCAVIKAAIDYCCDKGNLDQPDLSGRKKGRKAAWDQTATR